jgi:hypothetical protein
MDGRTIQLTTENNRICCIFALGGWPQSPPSCRIVPYGEEQARLVNGRSWD